MKKAFLVAVYTTKKEKEEGEGYLEELHRLCITYGLEVLGSHFCSVKKIEASTFLGAGKVQELILQLDALHVDIVLFDDEMTPNQQRNLEKLFRRPVMDRTELIIEVFAQRAQTREARLQVELAKLKYQLPRLKRLWTHLSRQTAGGGGGGGGYLRGAGELQIELDRRATRKRISLLEKEIEEVKKQREVQRRQRIRRGIPIFAIVGYTNAGKSTLLNTLTQSGVLVEDKLFATLDTTTKKFVLPNKQEILLIDTVGFIRKIPHSLVAAFKGTLEEIVHTDVLLHLVDVSNPMAEQQVETAIQVINSIGIIPPPMITVLNKIDICKDPGLLCRLRIKYPKTVQISALTKEGCDDLFDLMMQEIKGLRKIVYLRIPQSHYSLVSELLREGRVIKNDYEGNHVLLHVEIPGYLESKTKPFNYDVI